MDNRPQRPQRPINQGQPGGQQNVGVPDFSSETRKQQLDQLEHQYKSKKTGRLVKILTITGIIIVLGIGFYFLSTGLNDSRVVNLNQKVTSLEATIQAKESEIGSLKKAVEDTTVKEVIPTTSLQRVGGSEVPEFWLIEGDFIAPNILEMPTSYDDINNTNIQIGSKFKFLPSESWLVKVKGATVEFSHPTKIWGKVKAIGQKDRIAESAMQETIQKFFIGYPGTTITYRKLFIEDRVVGMMGRADIKVKESEGGPEKEMVVNIGFAQRSDFGINFLFVNDKSSEVAQELIDLLLKSGTYGDSKLKLE